MGKTDFNEILLEANQLWIDRAVDASIRTGVPLVVERNGKIVKIKPEFKYVRVPIKTPRKSRKKT